ncbi:MAG: hypothetical protein LBE91_04505, partial [Tannerella sp.]|nr:hypothetical protein [Tannerella sp.]
MKRIVFNLIALVLLGAAFTACNNEQIVDPDIPGNGGDGAGTEGGDGTSISLRVYVPNGGRGVSTYAGEFASGYENVIDTMFVDLRQGAAIVETDTVVIPSPNVTVVNDSTWILKYEVDGLTTGAITAEVYANRRTAKVINAEIPLPDPGNRETLFMMTGTGSLVANGSGTGYEGTVHIQRNVAKLRINVSKNDIFLPSDLEIDYPGIEVQVLDAATTTLPFGPAKNDVAVFDYAERSAHRSTDLTKFSLTGGGQVDSAYLYENYRNSYSVGTNVTQVRVTIPTLSPSEGNKTDSYVYTIYTNNPDSTFILRNYIYTLDIKVRGQSLEPLVTLDLKPWNDIAIDGSILGTYLKMETSEIEFDASGRAEIRFCTDAQAVYIDYDEFNNNNAPYNIGDEILTENIQPADQNLVPGYEGQVILDKTECNSFVFKIDPSKIDPSSIGFSGNICIKAGNIRKCISFVGQRIYDAHYIVGDYLLGVTDKFTSAIVETESGIGDWLEVSS